MPVWREKNRRMLLTKLLEIIENILPGEAAIEGDRFGLQIQSSEQDVKSILAVYEITDDIIEEAIENGCDCIISFHPLIYYPLSSISLDERVGRLAAKLIKNSISLITIHTNFDSYHSGTSKILADRLGLQFESFLIPNSKLKNFGMGIIASTYKLLTEEELISKVHDVCSSPLRFCTGSGQKIEKIAIVGGSGSSFLDEAITSGAQAFITADISYHNFHKAQRKIMLIDAGHYETEQHNPFYLAKLLSENIDTSGNLKIISSKKVTNPVRYYPETENYFNKQMSNISQLFDILSPVNQKHNINIINNYGAA
ncbi:MAG: hypothetical protein HW421_2157 [Ignavibacteria bacterium]|nr:hypothetical protein [Ignavibacteria bacterium]